MPNRFQILRDQKGSVSNCLIYCALIYFAVALGAAAADVVGVTHGTYYAIYLHNDFLVAAIESRRTFDDQNGRRSYIDDTCKILPLGETAVFLAQGTIVNSDQRASVFDGFSLALESYRDSGHILERAAYIWADRMRPLIDALYRVYPTLINARLNGEIAGGFFLGFDNAGMLAGFKAVIRHQDNEFTTEVSLLGRGRYALLGPESLVRELLDGNTTRASRIRQQIKSEAAGKSGAELQMVINKYLVETIPGWAHDPGSGGDIAQVILETKTHRSRWFHRPDFCPEN
jgi:hypothetical protein